MNSAEAKAAEHTGASQALVQALECLTCIPIVGVVQRADDKFWERKVFDFFMRALGAHSTQNSAQSSTAEAAASGSGTAAAAAGTDAANAAGEKKDETKEAHEREDEESGMDDLAMFVKKGEAKYIVRRRAADQDVLLTRAEKEGIDWMESFLLNMVMQQLWFELTVYVCRRGEDGRYATLNQTTTRVYPSTVKVNVKSVTRRSTKQAQQDSYPTMYFTMYDFDDVFRTMMLGPGLVLCVDLSVNTQRSCFLGVPMAQTHAPARHVSVFCGAIDYAKIDVAFARQGGLLGKMAGVFAPSKDKGGPGESRDSKFITVSGPHKVGAVQFCFNKHVVANSSGVSSQDAQAQPLDPASEASAREHPLPTPPASPAVSPGLAQQQQHAQAAPATASAQEHEKEQPKKRGFWGRGKQQDKHTEYQCMPYFLSLDIHDIVQAIVKKTKF